MGAERRGRPSTITGRRKLSPTGRQLPATGIELSPIGIPFQASRGLVCQPFGRQFPPGRALEPCSRSDCGAIAKLRCPIKPSPAGRETKRRRHLDGFRFQAVRGKPGTNGHQPAGAVAAASRSPRRFPGSVSPSARANHSAPAGRSTPVRKAGRVASSVRTQRPAVRTVRPSSASPRRNAAIAVNSGGKSTATARNPASLNSARGVTAAHVTLRTRAAFVRSAGVVNPRVQQAGTAKPSAPSNPLSRADKPDRLSGAAAETTPG